MDELIFDNKKYLSSKRTGHILGYTSDYVGRLCREGKVTARLVGRTWYVEENSIASYAREIALEKERAQAAFARQLAQEYRKRNTKPVHKIVADELRKMSQVFSRPSYGAVVRSAFGSAVAALIMTAGAFAPFAAQDISKIAASFHPEKVLAATVSSLPPLPSFPKISVPEISIPEVSIPEMPSIPTISIPEVHFPTTAYERALLVPNKILSNAANAVRYSLSFSADQVFDATYAIRDVVADRGIAIGHSVREYAVDAKTTLASVVSVQILSIEIPSVEIPDVKIPKVSIPKISLPYVSVALYEKTLLVPGNAVAATGVAIGNALQTSFDHLFSLSDTVKDTVGYAGFNTGKALSAYVGFLSSQTASVVKTLPTLPALPNIPSENIGEKIAVNTYTTVSEFVIDVYEAVSGKVNHVLALISEKNPFNTFAAASFSSTIDAKNSAKKISLSPTGPLNINQDDEPSEKPIVRTITDRLITEVPRIVNTGITSTEMQASLALLRSEFTLALANVSRISKGDRETVGRSISNSVQNIVNNLPTATTVDLSAISGSVITNSTFSGSAINASSAALSTITASSVTANVFYGDGSNLTGITSFATSSTRGVFSATSSLTYSTSTGVFGINQASSTADGYISAADYAAFVAKENAIVGSSTGTYYRGDKTFQTLDTLAVTENSNLYFTNARAQNTISSTATGITYATSTGIFSLTSGYNIPLTASTTEWTNKVSSQWITSGANIYYNSGNVGIGTTSPIGKLDVSGSSASTDLVTFDTQRSISVINTDLTANNAQGIALRSLSINGTLQSGVKLLGVNTARTTTGLTTDFAILTNNNGTLSEKMRVLANGNVGIGTTTPAAKLQITGAAGSADIFALSSSTNTRLFTVTSAGNVGIAASSPTESLQVGDLNKLSNTFVRVQAGGASVRRVGVSFRTFNETNGFDLCQDDTLASAAFAIRVGNSATPCTSSSTVLASFQRDTGFLGLGSNAIAPSNVLTAYTGGGSTAQIRFGFSDANMWELGRNNVTGRFSLYENSTERFSIAPTSGAVGIGTTTPLAKLDIYGTAGSADIFALSSSTNARLFTVTAAGNIGVGTSSTFTPGGTAARVIQLSASGFPQLILEATGASAGNKVWRMIGRSSGTLELQALGDDSAAESTGLQFTRSTVAISQVLFPNGNVGIGTSTPSAKLQITGAAGSADIFALSSSTNARMFTVTNAGNVGVGTTTISNKLTINETGNAAAAAMYAANTSVDLLRIQSISAAGYSSIGFFDNNSVQKGGFGYANAAGGVIGNKIYFYSTGSDLIFSRDTGTSAALMIQGSTGNVGIGTSTPAYKLHVKGDDGSGNVAKFETSSGATSCTLNGSTGLLNCSSDLNLKKDIISISASSTFDRLLQLNPVSYRWKTEDESATLKYGFIAQEVELLFPELVSTDKDTGYKTLSVGGLVPFVVSSIKTISGQVTQLTTRVDGLANIITGWFSADGSKINVKGDVCVDDVCVTRDQFKNLLRNAGGATNAVTGGGNSSTSTTSGTISTPPTSETISTSESSSDSTSSTPATTPTIIDAPPIRLWGIPPTATNTPAVEPVPADPVPTEATPTQ